MAADLTVDNLCAALRFFFKQIADHPEQPVDQKNGITLHGTPGDDAMRAVLEAFGGEVKITLREMPVAMNQVFSAELATGQGAVLWSPSEEPEPVDMETPVSGEVEWFPKSPRPETTREPVLCQCGKNATPDWYCGKRYCLDCLHGLGATVG